MAEKARRLNVDYSQRAKWRLTEIWHWNAERYGEAHADEYIDFLWQATQTLSLNYLQGKPIQRRRSFRRTTVQKGGRGNGHIIVYEVRSADVYIIDIYHTAQDWENDLKKIRRP